MALILALALPDASGKQVFDEVLRIRPQAWPNLRLIGMGDAQLDCRGELVNAAAKSYTVQRARQRERPCGELVTAMSDEEPPGPRPYPASAAGRF
jgi:hypothetical protein